LNDYKGPLRIDIVTNLMAAYLRAKRYDECQGILNSVNRNDRNSSFMYNVACLSLYKNEYDDSMNFLSTAKKFPNQNNLVTASIDIQTAYILQKKKEK